MGIGYIVLIAGIGLVGFLVQNRLRSKFHKYGQVGLSSGMTGYQVAMNMLNHYGIRDVQVVRGQHHALDAEALRLVMGMPPWIPGQQHGKAVNVLYSMPIRFAAPPGATPPKETAQAPAAK